MKINIKLKVLKNMMNRKKYYRYKWKRKIVLSFWKQQSEKIGRRIYISFYCQFCELSFCLYFSSHKVYNIHSIYQLYIYWRHHLLVLMKLFNRWSSKSFFASLRRSLCLFFNFSLLALTCFHRKWIGFLFSFAFFWHSHR